MSDSLPRKNGPIPSICLRSQVGEAVSADGPRPVQSLRGLLRRRVAQRPDRRRRSPSRLFTWRLKRSQEARDRGDVAVAPLVLLKVAALHWLGHLPSLDTCVGCGGPIDRSGRIAFGFGSGGVLCALPAGGEARRFNSTRNSQAARTFRGCRLRLMASDGGSTARLGNSRSAQPLPGPLSVTSRVHAPLPGHAGRMIANTRFP